MKTFAFHHKQTNETQDHILEFLFDKREKKKSGSIESLRKLFSKEQPDSLKNILVEMEGDKLILVEKTEIVLTEIGLEKAKLLVRGHRLAQRMMVDVFGISPDNANKAAHFMEHMLDSEILDAISAFLGYPDISPDGKTIPHPSAKKIFTIKPVLCKLSDMEIGAEGRIRYIQNPVDALSQIGILPGELIRLIQKKPSVIIEMGQTTIAIDFLLAHDIYVNQRS
ncbi:MAG: metal-dependent transcriptional regulator [Spirochaetia bacterium]|nr:metal-dependent transcriptional regulator [Spirochaetia bacterium]